eukprot:gnl/TRDRNA2_/TRDRNA2_29857_c0_seq1.p1 gnl/TRDRNA2_/TRDRNA2_29857_c0~~gnl/TRDRNA2_/TRDRNA2_29857_c0_seq1.p1  ORF type:complete len:133 (-),score=12.55 gnl/TRDRNA2_/TRDRNA2_29857_c0_seq1:265-663(-)
MVRDRLTIEVYSFVSYLASLVASLAWLIWAFAPDEWLRAWGITYYPDRWWGLALPAYIVVLLIFIFISYVALNMIASCPLDSVHMISDSSTPPTFGLHNTPPGAIPPFEDIDLSIINEHLFPVHDTSPRAKE